MPFDVVDLDGRAEDVDDVREDPDADVEAAQAPDQVGELVGVDLGRQDEHALDACPPADLVDLARRAEVFEAQERAVRRALDACPRTRSARARTPGCSRSLRARTRATGPPPDEEHALRRDDEAADRARQRARDEDSAERDPEEHQSFGHVQPGGGAVAEEQPEPERPDEKRVEDPGHVVDGRVADALRVAVVQPVELEQQDEHRERDEPPEELRECASTGEVGRSEREGGDDRYQVRGQQDAPEDEVAVGPPDDIEADLRRREGRLDGYPLFETLLDPALPLPRFDPTRYQGHRGSPVRCRVGRRERQRPRSLRHTPRIRLILVTG